MAGVIDAITGILVNRRASRSPFAGRYVGWLAVTVERLPHELEADELPRPLAAFPHPIAVDIRPAPGAKGSELRARLLSEPVHGARGRASGTDPRQQLRRALRDAKQLIEVGEVLRIEPRPHGRRPPTPWGRLVDRVEKRADARGLL